MRGRGRWRLRDILSGAVLLLASTAAPAADRPFFRQAEASFYGLPSRARNEAYLELMATGDFNAMASDTFGPRLYDATTQFQRAHGIAPSGVLTPETRAVLGAVGGRLFNSWGLQLRDHPSAEAAVAVPGRFGLQITSTSRGFALENRRHTMSVAFSFFADEEATLQSVFDNLTRTAPGRSITLQVLKPDFMAVAGTTDGSGTYSRFIPVPGGVAGFTLSWDPDVYPDAGRIAVVMANELYPHRMVGGDLFARLPGQASPISPGANDDLVQHQRDVQEKAEQDSQAAQQRYADQLRQQQDEAEQQRAAQDAAHQAAEEQARVAREAEQAREAKAQEERRVAQEQLKAQRLATARTAANVALADASAFVKANKDDPSLISHLQGIADLKTAAGEADADAVDRRRADLRAALGQDSIYVGWEAQQVAERRREDARDLSDTLATLAVQRRFLVDRVAADPTATYASGFLSIVKAADALVVNPGLTPAQVLVGQADAAIEQAGLHDSYVLAKADAGKLAAGAGDGSKSEANSHAP